MTLDDFLDFERHGNETAFVDETPYRRRPFTYGDVLHGMNAAQSWLSANHVKEGDRIILRAENSARWAMLFYACVKMRVVVVPIDVSFSETFVDRIRQLTQSKLVWRGEDFSQSGPLPKLSSQLNPDRLLQIIYTSGTTGDPKGVMITHGNLLSNLEPVYREVQKYRKYAVPFSPLGFVHLIPLSHLFGQIMGLFIPQMLGGKVIFTDPLPSGVVRAVLGNRASAVICVPHELALLRNYVSGRHPGARSAEPGRGVVAKWWRHRRVHREFGWKFWAFICGGASLQLAEEEFWSRLGFAVIQGYGLTETAPSVTITHPFKGMKRGSVGKKLPGLDVRIAEDGEILVRGPNVSPGYYEDEHSTANMYRDGWLHTGDLGEFDEAGNLTILGRKKEVIVTANGLNVYPQDVEAVLEQDARVKEAAVVSRDPQHPEVQAVLVLHQDEPVDVVRQANAKLEAHQQILSHSVWPEERLPRTSTGKLMRMAIARGIASSAMTDRRSGDLLDRIVTGAQSGDRLDEDLGLSSLDRVDLMMQLEQRTGVVMDDAALSQARTLGDVAKLVSGGTSIANEPVYSAAHSGLVTRWLRFVLWYLLLAPALKLRVKVRTQGVDSLAGLRPPVLFVANHQSILDVPVILRALPPRLRRRIAPAMATDRAKWEQRLAAFFFNTYPLPGKSAGLREAIRHTGELADRGQCPLVFPEGVRTPDGQLKPFRPGIGVIAKHIQLPVVPIRIDGAYEIWPVHARGPSAGTVTITFGNSMSLAHLEPAEIVATLEKWYRATE